MGKDSYWDIPMGLSTYYSKFPQIAKLSELRSKSACQSSWQAKRTVQRIKNIFRKSQVEKGKGTNTDFQGMKWEYNKGRCGIQSTVLDMNMKIQDHSFFIHQMEEPTEESEST